MFAYYCFYNGWDGEWPAGVPWTVGCRKPANCPTVPDVKVFGCGLAAAADVAVILNGTRSTASEDYLPLQWPWSWLFASDYGRRPYEDALSALEGIISSATAPSGGAQQLAPPPLFQVLPLYATAVREDNTDLLASTEVTSRVPTSTVLVTDLRDSLEGLSTTAVR